MRRTGSLRVGSRATSATEAVLVSNDAAVQPTAERHPVGGTADWVVAVDILGVAGSRLGGPAFDVQPPLLAEKAPQFLIDGHQASRFML